MLPINSYFKIKNQWNKLIYEGQSGILLIRQSRTVARSSFDQKKIIIKWELFKITAKAYRGEWKQQCRVIIEGERNWGI